MTLRRRVHMALDSNIASDLWTATMHRLLVVLVLASVTAVVLESVPEIAAQYGFWFTIAEDVALGEVEVESSTGPVRLGEGAFFGEMALLRKQPRNANVRTTQSTKLLILDGVDLRSLMERNPEIRRRIDQVVQDRS